MKYSILFLLLINVWQAYGQSITLKKGDTLTYQSISFVESTHKDTDGTPVNLQEQAGKNITTFIVLDVLKNHYKMRSQQSLEHNYSRKKDSYGDSWKTTSYYHKNISRTFDYYNQEWEFDLAKNGKVSNFRVANDSLNLIHHASTDRPDFESFFIKLPEKPAVGQKIKVDSITYLISDITNHMIQLTEEAQNNQPQCQYLRVDHSGIVLERKFVFRVKNREQEELAFPTRSDKSTNRLVDVYQNVYSRRVTSSTKPFLCTFWDKSGERDTILMNTNVQITGKIKNVSEDSTLMIQWAEQSGNTFERYMIKVPILSDGSFEIRVYISEKTLYRVGTKSNLISEIYLFPGDNLVINFDLNDPHNNLEVTGAGESHVRFMFEKYFFEKQYNLGRNAFRDGIYDRLLDLSPNEMKQRSYDIYRKKVTFLEKYKASMRPDLYLGELYTYRILLEAALREYHFNIKYRRANGDINKMPVELRNEEAYFDFDTLIHADNDLMSFSEEYQHSIREYAYFYLSDRLKEITGVGNVLPVETKDYLNRQYPIRYELAELYFSGFTTYTLKFVTVQDALKRAEWDIYNQLYEQFVAQYPATPYAEVLRESHAKAATVRPGQPAYNFELMDMEGNTVRLSDFKGKAVYLKFWDPGCCVSEINAHGEAIDSLFADNENVAIVYIGLRTSAERAKKALEGKNLSSTQLVASPREAMILMDKYYFNDLSHNILIDPEGRIYDENAPEFYQIVDIPELVTKAFDPG